MVNTYGIVTDPKLREIQMACLDILKKYRDVCDKNGLRYYLAYGTLLGAIRHNGYIPWDDDIDIWMPRKDLDKFIKIAEQEMFPYIVNYFSIDNNAGFKYRTQLCIEDHRHKVGFNLGGTIKPGYIWIDIMAMDGMPDSQLKRKIQCIKFSLWYMIIGFARSSKIGASNERTKSLLKRTGIFINNKLGIGNHIDIKKCFEKFRKTKMRYDFDESNYIHGSTSYYTDKAVFLREWFDGKRTIEYEGELFSIPSGAEKILTSIYGDYMSLPPENKRTRSHFAVLNMD